MERKAVLYELQENRNYLMWPNEANLVGYQIIFNWQLFCIRLIQYLRNYSLTTCPYAKLKRISFIVCGCTLVRA